MASSILHLEWKIEWGAGHPGHRAAIRARLAELVPSAREQILDLDRIPDVAPLFVSISHCASLGGFALATVPVGLDFEDPERIDPGLVAKISSLEEFASFVDPRRIWPAKEAAFKCLRAMGLSPAGVSEIAISRSDEEFFTVDPRAEGRLFRAEGAFGALVTGLVE